MKKENELVSITPDVIEECLCNSLDALEKDSEEDNQNLKLTKKAS